MSGSQWGGIVGGVIGFVVTGYNPAGARWGYAIGPAVGAQHDPELFLAPSEPTKMDARDELA